MKPQVQALNKPPLKKQESQKQISIPAKNTPLYNLQLNVKNYTFFNVLGKGGFGKVFKVEDKQNK